MAQALAVDRGEASVCMLGRCAVYAATLNSTYWAARWLSQRKSRTFRRLDRDRGEQGYWAASIASAVHAVAITALCFMAVWDEPGLFEADDPFLSTPLSLACCELFMGYIFQDLCISLYYCSRWPGWRENLVHHVCALAACWSLASVGLFQGQCVAGLMLETTTPFVNARWLMDKAGMEHSTLYMVNGLTMLGLFFVFRVCLYSWLGVRFLQLRDGFSSLPALATSAFIACYLCGLCLQLFWFRKILQGTIKVLTAGDENGQPSFVKRTISKVV